jgi:hypothetical protein
MYFNPTTLKNNPLFKPRTTTGKDAAGTPYLPLLWRIQQSGAAGEHNDVTLLQSYSLAYFFFDSLIYCGCHRADKVSDYLLGM